MRKKTSFYLDPELLKEARHAAIDEGLSFTAWLVRLIEAAITRRKEQPIS